MRGIKKWNTESFFLSIHSDVCFIFYIIPSLFNVKWLNTARVRATETFHRLLRDHRRFVLSFYQNKC